MMTKPAKRVRCAVYTRVSTEYGLDQEFNSLDAQHEAAGAYIRSQAHDGWTLIRPVTTTAAIPAHQMLGLAH
jgi:site-specific DNA recombinase